MNALFICASIKSHFIPSFSFAKKLSNLGINITYTVSSEHLKELVQCHDFDYVNASAYNILCNQELFFLIQVKKKKGTFINFCKTVITSELYKFRRDELCNIINNLKPNLIVLDVYSSTDYIIIKNKFPKVKVVFINPMLTLESDTVDCNYKSNFTFPNFSNINGHDKIKIFILKILIYREYLSILKVSNFNLKELTLNKNFVFFINKMQIRLAPIELEIAQSLNSVYWGLGISISKFKNQRYFSSQDPEKKKIYCSFGTYLKGERIFEKQLAIVKILLKILEKNRKYELVCALCSEIIAELPPICNENIKILKNNINQLEQLSSANIFICHGGLGSIKESIFCSVPLLIFPLDLEYDQFENGHKVNFHKIGILGDIALISEKYISHLIDKILNNDYFHEKISELTQFCEQKYSEKYKENLILNNVVDFTKFH